MMTVETAMVLARLVAAAVGDPTPCKLVTTSEIASALGVAATAGKAIDPELDEIKAKSAACQFFLGPAKDKLLMVTVSEFDGAAAAQKGMDYIVKSAASNPEGVQMMPGSGLGDRSLWGMAEEGAVWAVLKGRQILSIAFGGIESKPAAARDKLKSLVVIALGRM